MLPQDYFKVKGKVVAVSPKRVCRVKLINGHEVTAYFDKRYCGKMPLPIIGSEIILKLSSFDLTQGKIVKN